MNGVMEAHKYHQKKLETPIAKCLKLVNWGSSQQILEVLLPEIQLHVILAHWHDP
jgi:hypothetical protein